MVAGTPDVIVLATSREPLDVQGERVVRVRGLAPKAALDLFVARAAPGAIESGADRDAVATVCDRLDHIPLAIELAAARTRSTHVRSLPDLLEDRFRLLTGGRRRTRGRQQTLEATIAWSFDLLDAEEAAALEAVAVFGGRFGVDTAARVLDVDEFLALDLIDALVARSLLEADFDDRTSMQTYSLLESIRVFAVDRLVSAGRIDDARARLCDVIIDDYLPIAGGTAHVLLHTGDVYASLDWARSVGDDERAIALDPALALCRYVDGRLDEAIETGRQTLDRVTDPRVRASLLGILAVATAYSGDLLGGRDHLDEALGIDPTDPVTLVNAFLLSPLTAGVDRERARADLALIDATAHEGAMAGIPDAQRAMIAMWDGDARSAANHAAASLASVKPRAGLRGVRSSFLGLRGIMTTMRLLALAVGPDPSEATRWLGDEPGALHLDRAELATPQGWSFRIDFDVVAAIAMLRAGERSRGHRHLGDAVAALDQRAPQPRRNHGTVAMALACAAYDGGDVATARALTSAVDVPSAGLVPGLAHLLADMEGVDDQDRDTWVRTVPIERVLLTDDAARDERDRVADDVIERLGLRS